MSVGSQEHILVMESLVGTRVVNYYRQQWGTFNWTTQVSLSVLAVVFSVKLQAGIFKKYAPKSMHKL